jgi:hypothetical protein
MLAKPARLACLVFLFAIVILYLSSLFYQVCVLVSFLYRCLQPGIPAQQRSIHEAQALYIIRKTIRLEEVINLKHDSRNALGTFDL